MQHISINVAEKIKNILPETLEKDLTDNEKICPVCQGFGIIKRDFPFGVKNNSGSDWYNNEYFALCPNCYFGVVKLCEFCERPLSKNTRRCDCDEYKKHETEKIKKNNQKMINRAIEVEPKDVSTYLYDEETGRYYAEVEDFVDELQEEWIDGDAAFWDSFDDYFENTIPKVLWVTEYMQMSMDATTIVEEACEELHEDALDNVGSEDINELQKYLNEWCKKQSGTGTYYPCYREYIRVKKEWFDS